MFKIKALREEARLTQKELAEKINTTNKNIWAYEKGIAQPSIETLIKLAATFNVSVDYLIGVTDDFEGQKKESALSYREQKLLRAFSQLENDEKDKIIEDCEYFANKHTKLELQRRA